MPADFTVPKIWGQSLKDLLSAELTNSEASRAREGWKSLFKEVWEEIFGVSPSLAALSPADWKDWVEKNSARLSVLLEEAGRSGCTHEVAHFALNLAKALEERYRNDPQTSGVYRNLERDYCLALAEEMGDSSLALLVKHSRQDPVELGHDLANLKEHHEAWVLANTQLSDAKTLLQASQAELNYRMATLELVEKMEKNDVRLASQTKLVRAHLLEVQGNAYARTLACQAYLGEMTDPSSKEIQTFRAHSGLLNGRIQSTLKMLSSFSLPEGNQILLLKQFVPIADKLGLLLILQKSLLISQKDLHRQQIATITDGLTSLKHSNFVNEEAKLLILGDVVEKSGMSWDHRWNVDPSLGIKDYQAWAMAELQNWQQVDHQLTELSAMNSTLREWSDSAAQHKINILYPTIVQAVPGFREKAAERLSKMSQEEESLLAQSASHRRVFQQSALRELAQEETASWVTSSAAITTPKPLTAVLKLPPSDSLAWELIDAELDTIYGQTALIFPEFKAKVLAELMVMAQQRGIGLNQMLRDITEDFRLRESVKVTVLLDLVKE